jgi:hypothetical protein
MSDVCKFVQLDINNVHLYQSKISLELGHFLDFFLQRFHLLVDVKIVLSSIRLAEKINIGNSQSAKPK